MHLPEGLTLAVGGREVDLAEIDRSGAAQVAVDGALAGHIAGAEGAELAGIAEIRGGAGGVQRAGADVLKHLIDTAHQIGWRRAAEQLGIGGGEVVVIAIRDRNQHRAAGAAHITAGHQGEVGGADGSCPAAAGIGLGCHVGGLRGEQLQEQGSIEGIVIGVVASYPLIKIDLLLGLWALVDIIWAVHEVPRELLHRGQSALVGADRRAHIALVDECLHLGFAEHKRAPARKRVGLSAPAAIIVLAGIAIRHPVVEVVAGVLAGHLLGGRRGGGPRWGVGGAVGDAEGGVLLGQGGGVDRIDRQAGGIQQAPATHREQHIPAGGDGVAGTEAARQHQQQIAAGLAEGDRAAARQLHRQAAIGGTAARGDPQRRAGAAQVAAAEVDLQQVGRHKGGRATGLETQIHRSAGVEQQGAARRQGRCSVGRIQARVELQGRGAVAASRHAEAEVFAGQGRNRQAGVRRGGPQTQGEVAGGAELQLGPIAEQQQRCADIAAAGADAQGCGGLDPTLEDHAAHGIHRHPAGAIAWQQEAHADRPVGLHRVGVVVLQALDRGGQGVVGLLAQETATGGPVGLRLAAAVGDLAVGERQAGIAGAAARDPALATGQANGGGRLQSLA